MVMRKVVTTTLCIIGLASLAGQAWAGKGPGPGQQQSVKGGNSGVTSPSTMPTPSNLVNCDELTFVTGLVQNFVTGGGTGMEIDLGEGDIASVYGIGSVSYWSSLGVDQPTIGENIEVQYATVRFSDGSTKDVAVTITFIDSDETVQLRDDVTCVPLWRGSDK